jgi:hypothetical protein
VERPIQAEAGEPAPSAAQFEQEMRQPVDLLLKAP